MATFFPLMLEVADRLSSFVYHDVNVHTGNIAGGYDACDAEQRQ